MCSKLDDPTTLDSIIDSIRVITTIEYHTPVLQVDDRTAGRTISKGFADYLIEMMKCVCCQNNYNDPDGHSHSMCNAQ